MSKVDKGLSGLAAFLSQHPKGKGFPRPSVNYFDRFSRVEEELITNVHPNANIGPAVAERLWMTDHGPDHIATVIRRASDLTGGTKDQLLEPYEAFILLMACHFHDVGNIFGRDGHEQRIREVISRMDLSLIGDDAYEHRTIIDVSTAHGGYVDGNTQLRDKDTISPLNSARVKRRDGIRVPLLAAILRFADELADDSTRTKRFLLDNGAINPDSEIYHAYARRLNVTVNMHENSVGLYFEIPWSDLARTFRKRGDEVFLLDEIFARTLKMHLEHTYCNRFMQPFIHVERINVNIGIFEDDRMLKEYTRIEYPMTQVGYPENPKTLGEICPSVRGMTGEVMSLKLRELIASGAAT